MKKSLYVALVTLACAGCANAPQPAGPHLTKDARLIIDPTKMAQDNSHRGDSPEQVAKELDDMCAQPGFQCTHDAISVSLVKPDGSLYHLDATPPIMTIQNDYSIHVLAGQTLYIEADAIGGKLVHMKLVSQVTHPEKTLIVSLRQVPVTAQKPYMMLRVHNPFDKALRYHAGMMVLDGPDGAIYATDTCPVLAHIDGVENWPMPIFQVIMGGPVLLDSGDKMDCGY